MGQFGLMSSRPAIDCPPEGPVRGSFPGAKCRTTPNSKLLVGLMLVDRVEVR